ncbi:MAG: hypothetical protein ACMUIG_01760 [Thermoplasmatota archaeon]
MDYVLLSIPKGKSGALGRIVQDDLVSRQTIAVREASGLGMEGDDTYVLIEGSDQSLKKAVELLGDDGSTVVEGKEEIYTRIKKAEDEVAEGLGLMFG